MFYDPKASKDVKSGGNLPHWQQDGKVQFVTFRLADSLPSHVISELKSMVEEFKRLHPQPWNHETRREYWELIGPKEERLLDKGHGSCILKKPEIREIVRSAILHQDHKAYHIIAFVIMPNHVHILIQPLGNISLSTILHSIKRFSALQINHILNRQGQLWMNESFDRIVRSKEHLNHYIEYIKSNPIGFRADEYLLYVNSEYE